MIVDCDFVVEERIVQVEQILNGTEQAGVYVAVTIEECLELQVFAVLKEVLLQFSRIVVAFRVVELVDVLMQVPVRKLLPEPELAHLEWLVVDQRQHICLIEGVVDDFSPDDLVSALTEKQVINHVEHRWVVQPVGDLFKALLKSLMQFRVAKPANAIGVHDVA